MHKYENKMSSKMSLDRIIEIPNESGRSALSDDDIKQNGTNGYDDSPIHSDIEIEKEDEEPVTSRSRTGKTNSARKSRRNVDMTPPEELLEQAQRKARHFAEKKKETEAVQMYIRCTALARIVYGCRHWKLAKTYADLATAYYDLKGYAPQAEYHAESAIEIMKDVQMTSEDKADIFAVIINIYYTSGRAQAQQKKYQPASESLLKAEEVNRKRKNISGVNNKESDQWAMKINTSLGKLKTRQKAWGQAESYYNYAIELTEKLEGQNSASLIPLYQALGRVEQSKGDLANHQKAIQNYEQAHEIASLTYKDGAIVGDTAASLAEAYANVSDGDAEISAESYYRDAHGIYLRHYGPEHEKTIHVKDQVAYLQIRSERTEEAIATLKETLDAKKEVYGDLSAPVAESYKLIGNVYLAQEDMEKALRALKKCLNIETSIYGKNNKKTKDTQRTIDILLANPSLAAKHKKNNDVKDRPRFNNILKRESRLGGVRTDCY